MWYDKKPLYLQKVTKKIEEDFITEMTDPLRNLVLLEDDGKYEILNLVEGLPKTSSLDISNVQYLG